ncbi:GNAT family N-acetyltransferase [Kribbella sp. NPDC023855]|uniref:GNAT family N-acetyltransferase n=1 Tax=Kribbella sp. NPDC023855 TaxID=3154698 RepID=UPI0033FCE152
MVIRAAEVTDAEALSQVRRDTFSYSVVSPAAMRHAITMHTPAEQQLALVAEVDGVVVASGSCGRNTWTSEPGQAQLSLYVHPRYRRQGIATALHEQLDNHLADIGVARVRAFATPDGQAFAERLGYERSRELHYSGVDLQVLPDQPPTPEGIVLETMDKLDPKPIYTADMIASLDEPGDSPLDSIEYDEWFEEVWKSPALDKSLSVAALAGDEVVCFTAMEIDGDRAWSGMTGTIPQYRGRGLAKLVKSVALRRCAQAGIVSVFTSNDDANGPMLAINNWLGYQRIETQTSMLRVL